MAHRHSRRAVPGWLLSWRPALALVTVLAVAAPARSVHAAPAFPLTPSGDGRYLVDQGGVPFRIQGEAAWSAVANLTSIEQDSFLANRAAKGINTLLVNLFERRFALNAPNDRSGNPPFTSSIRPNPAYLAAAAGLADRAAAHGQLVLLDVMYLGYGGAGTTEGWYDRVASSTAADATYCGTTIGTYFGSRPNVLFVIGGDYTLGAGGSDATVATRLQQIRQGAIDAGATQRWTAHWGPESTSGSVSAFASLIDLRASYSYLDPAGFSRSAYSSSPTKPAFFMEGNYENEHLQSRAQIRASQWRGYLGAIGGEIQGACPIWHFDAPSGESFCSSASVPYDSWQNALEAPGSLDHQRMGALLDAVRWYDLQPEGLAGVAAFTTGASAAAATPQRDLALVYLASNGTAARSVTIDRSIMAAAFTARWWNPTTGAFTVDSTGNPNTGSAAFTTPGNNGTGTNDWVLVLDHSAVTAPLSISPADAGVPPRGSRQFTASGGSGTGYAWSLATNASGGSVASTGLYTAGATGGVTDVVRLDDSGGASTSRSISVGPGVSITPASTSVRFGGQVTFSAAGGSGSGWAWSLQPNASGASIGATSGAYTAGATPGTDVVRAQDSLGNSATAAVTVSASAPVPPASGAVEGGCGCGARGGGAWALLPFLAALHAVRRRAAARRPPRSSDLERPLPRARARCAP